jgi:hypothetical protein
MVFITGTGKYSVDTRTMKDRHSKLTESQNNTSKLHKKQESSGRLAAPHVMKFKRIAERPEKYPRLCKP